jgi:hypothetical protein
VCGRQVDAPLAQELADLEGAAGVAAGEQIRFREGWGQVCESVIFLRWDWIR